MLLIEQMQAAEKSCDIQIFASDIDQDALTFARAGVYPENIAADVSAERLKQFFIKGEHTYPHQQRNPRGGRRRRAEPDQRSALLEARSGELPQPVDLPGQRGAEERFSRCFISR